MSSSKTPCAACKLQRRKCTPECVFAPYFPPDIPQKFQNVHLVFGASNVSKILTDLDVAQREEAVTSLAYEAEARIKDPVYGCVGVIAYLQQKLRHLTYEIDKANKEIAKYEGTHGFQPFLVPGLDAHHAGTTSNIVYGPSSIYPYNNMPSPQAMAPTQGGGNLVIRDPQQQQLVAGDMELRQVQELYGIYDQHQQPPPPQKDFISYSYSGGGSVSESGFNQAAKISASLALNTFDNPYQSVQLGDPHQQQQNQHHHNHHRHNLQEQLLPQQQTQHQNQPLHHQLQEQLLLSSSQQPQQQQLQPQPQHHLLQPQPQHQEQSKDKDGRNVSPTS